MVVPIPGMIVITAVFGFVTNGVRLISFARHVGRKLKDLAPHKEPAKAKLDKDTRKPRSKSQKAAKTLAELGKVKIYINEKKNQTISY